MTDLIWAVSFLGAFVLNARALADLEHQELPPVAHVAFLFALSLTMTASLLVGSVLLWSGIWSVYTGID